VTAPALLCDVIAEQIPDVSPAEVKTTLLICWLTTSLRTTGPELCGSWDLSFGA